MCNVSNAHQWLNANIIRILLADDIVDLLQDSYKHGLLLPFQRQKPLNIVKTIQDAQYLPPKDEIKAMINFSFYSQFTKTANSND